MKYFLDTNIFLRHLVQDNERMHRECRSLFIDIEKSKIKAVTNFYVFTEIVWMCVKNYKLPKDKIIKSLRAFQAMGIRLIDTVPEPARVLDLFENNNVKFIDCLIAAALTKKKNICLISYDKDFDKLEVKRKEPGEII